MQRYRLVIMMVLFGVVPVAAAFFFALLFLENQEAEPAPAEVAPVVEEAPPPAPPPETRNVLAAARALPVGTLLGEDDLSGRTLDREAIRSGHIVVGEGEDAGAGTLRGYAVREALAAGEPLTWSAVIGPGQRGFLAAVLRPGMRAVTVRVGKATGHAGLIDPGDRVDVILTADLQGGDREGLSLSRTILEDVRVVAVDRRIGNGPGSPEGGEERERTEVTTTTLEVSPAQGDRLVLGERKGEISLAVRSLATAATPPASSVAVDLHELLLPPVADVPAPALDVPGPALEAPLQAVRIFRGSEPAEEVLFPRTIQ